MDVAIGKQTIGKYLVIFSPHLSFTQFCEMHTCKYKKKRINSVYALMYDCPAFIRERFASIRGSFVF